MSMSLTDAVFWAAVVSCAVAQTAIIRSLFRSRATAAEGEPAPRFALELAWGVLPAVALAILLFVTWGAIHP